MFEIMMKDKNGSINLDQVIVELRGGGFTEAALVLAFIVMITYMATVNGFISSNGLEVFKQWVNDDTNRKHMEKGFNYCNSVAQLKFQSQLSSHESNQCPVAEEGFILSEREALKKVN
jgi:hypothetical protein